MQDAVALAIIIKLLALSRPSLGKPMLWLLEVKSMQSML
jgi:hypothetical protein